MPALKHAKLCIIGLGYVGLPLAVEFGKHFPTIGFDTNRNRIDELLAGHDKTLEINDEELGLATQLSYTSNKSHLHECNVYIVTVPTPIDQHNNPDLSPLRSASRLLGEVITQGDVAIFESTVYPLSLIHI